MLRKLVVLICCHNFLILWNPECPHTHIIVVNPDFRTSFSRKVATFFRKKLEFPANIITRGMGPFRSSAVEGGVTRAAHVRFSANHM